MSWSTNGEVDTSQADWEDVIYNQEVTEALPDIKDEQAAQVKWAKETVADAIDSGVVGTNGGTFAFSITGHANPEHKPRSGWANDIIAITVSQRTPPVRE